MKKKRTIKKERKGTGIKMNVVVTMMTTTSMLMLSLNSALETLVIFIYMLETVIKD
jgi:hypothetical protein